MMPNALRKLLRTIAILLIGLGGLTVLAILVFRQAAWMRETETGAAIAPENGRWVSTPKGAVFTLEAGLRNGHAIALTHGTAAWSGLWQETLDMLGAEDYDTITVDFAPFGFSDRMNVE